MIFLKTVMNMIFSKHKLAFKIIDVLKISSKNVRKENPHRHFSALSFRISSDAVIKYSNHTLTLSDGSVTYFPADLDYLRIASHDEMIVIHLEMYNYAGKDIETYMPSDTAQMRNRFEEIYREWSRGKPDRFYRATAMLYSLFAEIYGECALLDTGDPRTVTLATRRIHEQYTDPDFTVAQLASELSVSAEYLRRIFRERLGVSPKKYLQDLRLRRAAASLTSGYFSVKEVAESCGFTDEKYFSVAFKKATGCSPSKYIYQYRE